MSLVAQHSFRLGDKKAAPWTYISLVFSLFYFLPQIHRYDELGLLDQALYFGFYFAFLAMYLKTVHIENSKTPWTIFAVLFIATAGSSITVGTNSLFGYALFAAGFYFKPRYAIALLLLTLGLITAIAATMNYWFAGFLVPAYAVSISLALYGILLQRDLIARNQNEKDQDEIEQLATIAERERIGRDLHDILGHSLSSIALKAELAEKYLAAGQAENAQKEVAHVAKLCRETLSEVRQSVTGLKNNGFYAEVEKISRDLQAQEYQVNLQLEKIELKAKTESALCLLLREACTNILRHSQADEVKLRLKQKDHKIELQVCDNGATGDINPGNGIKGMRERCQQLGGDLHIDNSQGFCLAFQLNNV